MSRFDERGISALPIAEATKRGKTPTDFDWEIWTYYSEGRNKTSPKPWAEATEAGGMSGISTTFFSRG